jgi:hypothetical protein
MRQKMSFALQFVVVAITMLISFSAQAATEFEKEMCSDAVHERCVSNAYNRFLQKHRDYSRWTNDLVACRFRFNHWQVEWQEYLNAWHKKCDGKALQVNCRRPKEPAKAESTARFGCMNTLKRMSTAREDALVAKFAERRRLAAERKKREQRAAALARADKRRRDFVTHLSPVGPDDVKKPSAPLVFAGLSSGAGDDKNSQQPVTAADLDQLRQYGNTVAVAASNQPPTESPKDYEPGTPEYEANKSRVWAAKNPEAAKTYNRPAQKVATSAGYSKMRINCIPEHVSIVKIADNGDLTLFIHKGADIYQLHRCLPNHDFDPVKVVNQNIAASTIPYYMEYSDRPIHRNKLHFHKGRWRLMRWQWKTSGKKFFADFFKEHKGKEFGFALQGGQKLMLAAKAGSTVPENKKVQNPTNAPAKHDSTGSFNLPSEIQNALASLTADFQAKKLVVRMSDSASVFEPCRQSERAELRLAINDLSRQDSNRQQGLMPSGQAIIRVGLRVARAMYIQKKRYRHRGGADINYKNDNVHYDAHELMSYRRHYGPYAFG